MLKSLRRIGWSAGWSVKWAGQGAGTGVAKRGLGAHGTGNGGGELLAVTWIADSTTFGGVAQVAAFEQDAGDLWITSEADSAADQATVTVCFRAGGSHGLLAAAGETVAIDPPIVALRTADTGRATVVMQADENRVTVEICSDHSLVEINEAVIAAHLDDFKVAAECVADAFGSI